MAAALILSSRRTSWSVATPVHGVSEASLAKASPRSRLNPGPTCTMEGEQALRLATPLRHKDPPALIPTPTRSTVCQAMRSKRVTRRRRTTLPPPSTTLTRRWATTVTPTEVHPPVQDVNRAVTKRWETRRRWAKTWSHPVQHLSLARQQVGETGATAPPPVEPGRGQEPEDMWSSRVPPAQRI